MQRFCANGWCGNKFGIDAQDLNFLEKVSPVFKDKKEIIPPPTLCPDCRMQRRLANVNRSHLYRRNSSVTGQEIISIFSAEKSLKVYENEIWWSDQWDPLEYGREPDSSSPILPQLRDLCADVPVMALFNDSNENSPFVNTTGWAKNCYLCYGADYSEDCYYGEAVYYCRNTVDSLYCQRLEKSYQCIDCNDGFGLLFAQNCFQCNDSAFIEDCIGCRDCFCCSGLRHKEYCCFNRQLTKEEYRSTIAGFFPLTNERIIDLKTKLIIFILERPHKPFVGVGNENVSGDYLSHSKNSFWCFDSEDLEDCKYCTNSRGAKDCRDTNYWGHPGELLYENMAAGEGARLLNFCNCCWGGTENLLYCTYCIACKDCFGCDGLRHKQHCIFNKQYTKSEYENLVPKIIDQMRKSGEWGEFFSVTLSQFDYNETLAQEFFPLVKEEILKRGWRWREEKDEMPKVKKVIAAGELPKIINEVPDDILNWAVKCETTERPFKIIKQELDFYRKMQLPVPVLHPDQRHKLRMSLRNPRKLWCRNCIKCGEEIETTYAPDRTERVFCEACYLKEVY